MSKKRETKKAESMPEEKAQQKAGGMQGTDNVKKAAFFTGKRKKAVARASIRPGKGTVTLNSKPVDMIENRTARLLVQEPLLLVGDAWKRFSIKVTTKGGGIVGQAQAARQAVARALAEALGKEAKEAFMEYDRNMLVYDPRRTEPHKPPRSSQGPRRYKQRSKR
jgi:small subunit ribosomal protein S9